MTFATFSDSLVSCISITGLILNMLGAAILVTPFIMGNRAILKLGAYKETGQTVTKGTVTHYNQDLIKSFQEARDKSFQGIFYMFVGFSLQLIQYIPLDKWYHILGLFFFILVVDWGIIQNMKKVNKKLSEEYEVV